MTDIQKLKALAEAFPADLDFDTNTTPFFNGPDGESLGGESTGYCSVYGQPFDIDGEQYDGTEYISICTKEFAEFVCSARGAVLDLIAEIERLSSRPLQGELNAAMDLIATYRRVNRELRSECDQLKAENEALRAEAAKWKNESVSDSQTIYSLSCNLAQRTGEVRELAGVVDDLAALTKKFVQRLSKAAPDNDLPAKAMDYLGRKGLQGSAMREIVEGRLS
jgi:hypothetical protein